MPVSSCAHLRSVCDGGRWCVLRAGFSMCSILVGTGTLHCTQARRQWYQGSSLDLGSRGLPGRLSEGRGPRAPHSHFSLRSRRGMYLHILVCFSQILRVCLESREPVREGWWLLTAQGRWLGLSGQRWEPHPFRLSLAVKLASGL